MMEHYVCKTCGGASDVPKNCEDDACPMKGQPLEPCHCQDGKHGKTDDNEQPSK